MPQYDGGKLLQNEVALIAVIEGNVPDEFVVGGDVVVGDHAIEPPATKLHPGAASDEGRDEAGLVGPAGMGKQ